MNEKKTHVAKHWKIFQNWTHEKQWKMLGEEITGKEKQRTSTRNEQENWKCLDKIPKTSKILLTKWTKVASTENIGQRRIKRTIWHNKARNMEKWEKENHVKTLLYISEKEHTFETLDISDKRSGKHFFFKKKNCRKNMLDVCCILVSFDDEYTANVSCQLTFGCSVSLLLWSLAWKCCSSQVLFMSSARCMQSGARIGGTWHCTDWARAHEISG